MNAPTATRPPGIVAEEVDSSRILTDVEKCPIVRADNCEASAFVAGRTTTDDVLRRSPPGGRATPPGGTGNSWASMGDRHAGVVGKVACVRTFGRRGGAMCESALGGLHAGTLL